MLPCQKYPQVNFPCGRKCVRVPVCPKLQQMRDWWASKDLRGMGLSEDSRAKLERVLREFDAEVIEFNRAPQ